MRFILSLLVIAAAGYAFVHYVPTETRERLLEAVGLREFFEQTVPDFLQQKLSIPENPVSQRKELISQLSERLSRASSELGVMAPTAQGGSVRLPSASEIRERVEQAQQFLTDAKTALTDLENINADSGVLQKVVGRVVGALLPSASAPAATSECK